jgi:hypothetical protein
LKSVRAWGCGDDGSIHSVVWDRTNDGWSIKWIITDAEGGLTEGTTIADTRGDTPKFEIVDGPSPQTIIPERLP